MRGDFLGGGNLAGVFLDQVFNGLDTNSFALGRVEESVFVAFYRNNMKKTKTVTSLSLLFCLEQVFVFLNV